MAARPYCVLTSLAIAVTTVAIQLLFHWTWFSPLMRECLDATPLSGRFVETGMFAADTFICMSTPLFEAIVRTRFGIGTLLWLAASYLGFALFAAVESSRVRHPAWLGLMVPMTLLLGQAVGISVAVPLVWLPAFLSQPRGCSGAPLPLASLLLAPICVTVIAASICSIPFAPIAYRKFAIAVFLIVPAIHLLVPIGAACGTSGGRHLVARIYAVAASLLSLLHLYAVWMMVIDTHSWSNAVSLLVGRGDMGLSDGAVSFLLIDAMSLGASLLLLASSTCKTKAACLVTLTLSAVIGPGAVLLINGITNVSRKDEKTQ